MFFELSGSIYLTTPTANPIHTKFVLAFPWKPDVMGTNRRVIFTQGTNLNRMYCVKLTAQTEGYTAWQDFQILYEAADKDFDFLVILHKDFLKPCDRIFKSCLPLGTNEIIDFIA